jgi:hypothetical protein
MTIAIIQMKVTGSLLKSAQIFDGKSAMEYPPRQSNEDKGQGERQ